MRFILLCMLSLISIPFFSQDCNLTLSGTVTDSHDETALEEATLVVAGYETVAKSNTDGTFILTNLCEGTIHVQVFHANCNSEVFTVKIKGDTQQNFKLEHHLEELNQVTIQGKGYENKSKTLDQKILNQEQLEQYSNSSLGDALNSLSGVSSLNTGNTVVKPLINGLHSSRVTVINNGVRMEAQEWGAEHAPNIDVNSIGNLTLIKGAGALQYSGDAVGGVIIAEAPRVPIKDSLYGKTLLTAASNGKGATLSSSLTKSYKNGWYAKAQATLKRMGDFESPDYILSNTGMFERSAFTQIGFNKINYGVDVYYSIFKNELGILSASHLGGAQDQLRAINNGNPLVINDFTYDINAPKQDVTHHLARLKAFKKIDGLGKLELQYDFQQNERLEYDIRRGENAENASLDLELKTHTLLLDLHSRLNDKWKLKTGISGRYQTNFADPGTGVRRLIPDYDKYDFGVYGIATFAANDDWLLEAGARMDYTYLDAYKYYRTSFWESRNYDTTHADIVVNKLSNQVLTRPQLHFPNVSATLGSTYDFGEDYKLFVNYSMASRAPNPSELFSEGLHHSAARIELGDMDFKSEIGHKISINLEKTHSKFSYSINPYFQSISNFIVAEPVEVQQTIRGNFQVWEYRQTNAQLFGVDLDTRYAFSKHWDFTHQFSLIKGYDTTQNEALINIPAVQTKNKLGYQNPSFKNLRMSLESEYFFRQNEFPNTNFEIFIPETETYEMVDLSTPPNAYLLLHFSSSIDAITWGKSTLTVGFTIQNMLNTSYRNYLNRQRYYADELGRNFLLNIKINY